MYILYIYGSVSKPCTPGEHHIAGKWMFIPLKMIVIGFDPLPYIYTQTIPKSILGLFSLQHLGETWQMLTHHHLPPGDCRSRPPLQLLPLAGQLMKKKQKGWKLDSFSGLILFSEVKLFKILKPFFFAFLVSKILGSFSDPNLWRSLERSTGTFLGRECTAWAQLFPMSPSTYVPSGYD